MPQHVTRGSRFLAGALALALASVFAATCFAAVMQMSDAQSHACCAGMNEGQDCDESMGVQRDCCIVQSADLSTRSQSHDTPVLVDGVVIEPRSATTGLRAAVDSNVPIVGSPPIYLLVSSFRI